MPDRQKDLRDCLTAYDCRDRLPELSAWMDDDLLKELTIWRGTRFERDEEYFDLDNPERGPFVATGAEGPPTAYTYVSRGQAGEEAWAQLVTWRQPVSESQGEAIQRLADEFGTGPAQSAAGIMKLTVSFASAWLMFTSRLGVIAPPGLIGLSVTVVAPLLTTSCPVSCAMGGPPADASQSAKTRTPVFLRAIWKIELSGCTLPGSR